MTISKRQKTQYNHFCKVRNSLQELFSRTKSFQLDIDQYLDLQDKMYLEHPSKKKLNSYYTGCLSGIEGTLFGILQSEWVEWFHYYEDNGVTHYVKKWEELPTDIRVNQKFKSNHFWKNPADPQNPKPWGRPVQNQIQEIQQTHTVPKI